MKAHFVGTRDIGVVLSLEGLVSIRFVRKDLKINVRYAGNVEEILQFDNAKAMDDVFESLCQEMSIPWKRPE